MEYTVGMLIDKLKKIDKDLEVYICVKHSDIDDDFNCTDDDEIFPIMYVDSINPTKEKTTPPIMMGYDCD